MFNFNFLKAFFFHFSSIYYWLVDGSALVEQMNEWMKLGGKAQKQKNKKYEKKVEEEREKKTFSQWQWFGLVIFNGKVVSEFFLKLKFYSYFWMRRTQKKWEK